MTEYKISKEQCQTNINGVCSHCGGELVPLETVDNAGAPTFWIGCESCSRFESGVSPEIFKAAEKLVTQFGYRHYHHMSESPNDSEEMKAYHQSCQISGACRVVQQVLCITDDARKANERTAE